MNITIVAGARPNFMKIAPIMRAIKSYNKTAATKMTYRLVHTGQHYDDNLSKVFFEELELPDPDINLGAGSGSQAEQSARIMIEFEKDLIQNPADLVVVVGDVTSTMACTIVAKKLSTKVAHVEAGIRSFDLSMPEEINRMVTDSIADYFFTTSEVANQNLKRIGVPESKIYFVGNTMIDSLYLSIPKLQPPKIWRKLNLQTKSYFLLTLHRPSNADFPEKLLDILTTLERGAAGKLVVFPVHPRTRKNFQPLSDRFPKIKAIDPLSYLQFIYLLRHTIAVITDSGGVQEESTVLGIPCITLRTNTERPETVTEGTNELVGNDRLKLSTALANISDGHWKKGDIPRLWDGHTGERIVSALSDLSKEIRQK